MTSEKAEDSAISWKQVVMQLLACVLASQAITSVGLCHGWSTVANWQLQQAVGDFQMSMGQRAWVVSVPFLGVGAGSLFGGFLSQLFGSRKAIVLTIPLRILGSATTFFSSSYPMLLTARLMVGLGAGVGMAVSQTYISGTASPSVRGALSVTVDIINQSQIIVIFILGDYISWWWLEAVIMSLVAVPIVILYFVLPSDPVWLVGKGRLEEAERSAKFFGLKIDKEHRVLPAPDGNHGLLAIIKSSLRRENLQPLWLVLTLLALNAFSGYVAIRTYSLEFFHRAGLPINATLITCLFSGIRGVGAMVSALFIDRFGRKSLLMVSSGGMSMCYLLMVIYYNVPLLQNYPIIPIGSLLAAMFIYAIGVGGIPWVLLGEIFPMKMRQVYGSFSATCYNVFGYASVLVFPIVMEKLGESGLFAMYSCTTAAIFLFDVVFLPETKGLTLSQIQRFFAKHEIEPPDENPAGSKGAVGECQPC